MWSVIRGRTGGLKFLVGVISNRRREFLGLQGDPLQFSSLVGHPNALIRKTLRWVLGLLTVMILKRLSESIFFESNKSTARVKNEKDVAIFLMAFNLSIHYPSI